MSKFLIIGILIVLLLGIIFYIYYNQKISNNNYNYESPANNNYNYESPANNNYGTPVSDSYNYDDIDNINNSTNYDNSKDNIPTDSVDSSYSNNTNNNTTLYPADNTYPIMNTNTTNTTNTTYTPDIASAPFIPEKIKYAIIYRSSPNWAYGIIPNTSSYSSEFQVPGRFWAYDVNNMKQSNDYFNVYKSEKKKASDNTTIYYTSYLGEMKGINTSKLIPSSTVTIFGIKSGEVIGMCVKEINTPYKRQSIVPVEKCTLGDVWTLLFNF